MPFIITAEHAASAIAPNVARRKTYAVIPWPMALIARLMQFMPRRPHEAIAARAGCKPWRRGGGGLGPPGSIKSVTRARRRTRMEPGLDRAADLQYGAALTTRGSLPFPAAANDNDTTR